MRMKNIHTQTNLEDYQYNSVQSVLEASWVDLAPVADGSEVLEWLTSIGLSAYYGVLLDQGFNTLYSVSTLNQTDLKEMHVKLADRKTFERHIADLVDVSPEGPVRSPLQELLLDLSIFPEDQCLPISTLWVMQGAVDKVQCPGLAPYMPAVLKYKQERKDEIDSLICN